MCCDHIRSKKDLEDTLVHELTHAFDSLRKGKFKSICHLIACGEIRASALGNNTTNTAIYSVKTKYSYLGQCANIKSETKRNQCIFTDAVNSTEIHCGSKVAEQVVKEVFQTCVNDQTPFK